MSKPGPKPKPSHLKLLKGEKRPSRVNYDEPEAPVDGIGPTVKLSDDELAVWNETVPEIARLGVLGNVDSAALTRLVQLETMQRDIADKYARTGPLARGSTGQIVRNPLLTASLDVGKEISKLWTEFGMTPSSRSRLHVPKPNKPRGFGDLDD